MKRHLAIGTMACLALGIFSIGVAHAAATGPQEISGFVRDANGKPANRTCVTIVPDGSPSGQTATVQSDGSYLLSNVPVGSWMAYAWDCAAAAPNYAPVTFRNVPGIERNPSIAEFVRSLHDAPNIEVNFTINKGGTITAKATNPAGKGIPGATVCPYFASTNVFGDLVGSGRCATANAKGIATIKGVQPGASKLQITAGGYLPLWYGGSDFESATSVMVVAGKTTKVGDVDVDVDPTGVGTVSGRITAPNGAPIPGACATVWLGLTALTASTNPADGTYTVANVPAGAWEVTGSDCNLPVSVRYAPTVYKNNLGSLDPDVADKVLVLDGAAVSGIDMKLAVGGTGEVHVVDSTNGAPISGANACPYWWQLNKFDRAFQSGFCTGDHWDWPTAGTPAPPGVVPLTGLRVGKNKIAAGAPGYASKFYGGSDFASAGVVTVKAGAVAVITIELEPLPE